MKTTAKRTATLYLGDNGRLTCGELRCAGSTAYSSKMKRDLSGQLMERLTPDMVRELAAMALDMQIACETCGAEASLLIDATTPLVIHAAG